MARRYRTGDRLPDRDPTPPESDNEPRERNPAIGEDELASLQVTATGQGWMADPNTGLLCKLTENGQADVRWICDNRPDLRESFGDTPPESWAA